MGDLVPLYRDLVDNGANFRGLSLLKYSRRIYKLLIRTQAQSLLDYGSGKGEAYGEKYAVHRTWGVPRPRLYDPSFDGIGIRPTETFDGVICSDVLEHIPEYELKDAITYMMKHSRMFIWASVCCRPAKKCFADGVTNLHVTIRPILWWRELFEYYKDVCGYEGEVILLETL